MGLVIVDKIIKAFGGKIDFESEEGVGSKFTFTFKLEDDQTFE